jgi:Copper type II ascorbate-dependent monooxygenase, C-terminal domain
MRRLLLLVLALAVAAAPADARRRLKKPKAKQGFQMRVGRYTVKAGEDLEVCEYRRLPIKKAMDVQSFALRMPVGAHHFAMWAYGGRTTDDSKFPKGPVENVGCQGMAKDDVFPQLLIPTQSPNVRLTFPEGVALHLEPHEQVWLNPHMKNFRDRPIVPDVRFNFYRAKKGTVKHYAEALTFGTVSGIHVPPGGDQTLTAEWTTPIDITVIHLSTHQHRLGTHAFIEAVAPDGTREMLVETDDWEHPASVWPHGGLRLAKGRKLRITCSWHNTDDHVVGFGPETTDEMCFGIGFFYRDPGDTTPAVGGGCLPAKAGLLCPLAPVVAD